MMEKHRRPQSFSIEGKGLRVRGPFEFNPASIVKKTCWIKWCGDDGRMEPMKNIVKKTNPAFKLRQVLPQLPNLSGRAGVVAKDVTKVTPGPSPAAGTSPVAWVTTE